jgi:hypothetical protein
MMLLLFFIQKFFVFTFILAILYLIKEIWRFVRGLNTGEYELGKHTLLWIGLSVAHIITTLITGFVL